MAAIGKFDRKARSETQSLRAPAVIEKLPGIDLLPISFGDTVKIINLPLHHQDPFDRMLIAQAMNHSLTLVSCDAVFSTYPIQLRWE
jgi:PIN domain nuclease of toxin-antitoxin system